ncbi:MAG TPA: hypothetical protein DCR40_04605 [Prolixibacteraceae bacterium]|nr:hypothetical protein [Prolixibacteraceae bacterium]
MDTVLSAKNRAKKRKDNSENKVEKKTIKVENARYVDGYKIEIEFNDHSFKTIDFGIFLTNRPHPQYNKYNDTELFKQFKIEDGNLVWGENWDLIFPVIQLYRGNINV